MAQIPKIRATPVTSDPALAGWMDDVAKAIGAMASATPPPQPISNLQATPVAGGVVVGFTRSNATNFRLYSSSTNSRIGAQITDLGSNNQWTDNLGKGGVARWYWVEALSPTSGQPSSIVGPVHATSLALGTPATVTPPAQPSYATVHNATTGQNQPAVYATDFIPAGKKG